jgi:hypothetical protein
LRVLTKRATEAGWGDRDEKGGQCECS